MMTTPCSTAKQAQQHRFWQVHINTFKQSGLTRTEYCRQSNLSYHALTYWLRKQPAAPTGNLPVLNLVHVPFPLPVPSQQAESPLRLFIADSYRIELSPNFNETTLERVLALLEKR